MNLGYPPATTLVADKAGEHTPPRVLVYNKKIAGDQ